MWKGLVWAGLGGLYPTANLCGSRAEALSGYPSSMPLSVHSAKMGEAPTVSRALG